MHTHTQEQNKKFNLYTKFNLYETQNLKKTKPKIVRTVNRKCAYVTNNKDSSKSLG